MLANQRPFRLAVRTEVVGTPRASLSPSTAAWPSSTPAQTMAPLRQAVPERDY